MSSALESKGNSSAIKDAVRIARILRKHLDDEDGCSHCRSLFSEVFES